MGCPSNVRLYTSYYNNFIMAEKTFLQKVSSPLYVSHGVNLILHGVSLYYSATLSSKVSDSQKYSLTEVKSDGSIAAITDKDNIFYMINPMNQLTIMNIIVIVTMVVHMIRGLSDGVRDTLSYDGDMGEDGEKVLKGSCGIFMQLLHIAAYGISHFLAIYIVFLISGYRDLLSATLIFVSVIGLEALQHFSSNPNKPELNLNPLSRAFIGFFTGVPTLVAVIMVGVAIENRDLPNGVLGFVALLVLEGLKFLVQVLKPIRTLVGDSRVAHAYHDALIKVFAVWFLLIQSLQKDGGIDGETTELSDRTMAVGWAGLVIFVLYFAYALLAYNGILFTKSPDEEKLKEERRNFPSGSMEEKTRMLQVA